MMEINKGIAEKAENTRLGCLRSTAGMILGWHLRKHAQ
jgi:hypothetical protein